MNDTTVISISGAQRASAGPNRSVVIESHLWAIPSPLRPRAVDFIVDDFDDDDDPSWGDVDRFLAAREAARAAHPAGSALS